jgi:DNA-binding transcriptional MerR regulator
MYKVQQIANLVGVSVETVRRWCLEFADDLDDDANSGEGRTRLLTLDDWSVLSLVAEMKGQGRTYADIHKALKEGRRGAVPANPDAIIPADRSRLAKLQSEVARLLDVVDQLTKDLDKREGRIEELTLQLAVVRRELSEAYKEIGRLTP